MKSSRPYAIAVLVVALPLIGLKIFEYGYRDHIAKSTMWLILSSGMAKGDRMLVEKGARIEPRRPPICGAAGQAGTECKGEFMRKLEMDRNGQLTVWLAGELRLQQGKLGLEGHRMVLSPAISGSTVEWGCRTDLNHKFVPHVCSAL